MSASDLCPECLKPVSVCPYGGDCAEMKTIYREQQREKLRDLDPEWCEEYAREQGLYADREPQGGNG